MPIVVNSNASATAASFNLSRSNNALRDSLEKLSSGRKINGSGDDAGGLAVAYKVKAEGNRALATIQNIQNALSYLQVQDGAMKTVGTIYDRMSQLRVMADDITKNSGDIENYSKEFVELQIQLDQIQNQKFNGMSLFAIDGSSPNNNGMTGVGSYLQSDGSTDSYQKFGRKLLINPSSTTGFISINVINFEFVSSYDLVDPSKVQVNADDRATRITDFSVSNFTAVIEKIADARAENGAEQNRVLHAMNHMEQNYTKLEAAHGRIMDTDIAYESTKFARNNVLVQAGAAMTAQANQLSNIALQLLG
jgi:flagellin